MKNGRMRRIALILMLGVTLGLIQSALAAVPGMERFGENPGEKLDDRRIDVEERLVAAVKKDLQRKYPQARVEVSRVSRWLRGALPMDFERIQLSGETGRGEVQFEVYSQGVSSTGLASYSAWMPVRLAVRRLQSGERLKAEDFVTQDVSLSSGQGYELRNVLLESDMAVQGLETRQLIQEGQMLLSTSVQRTPDVRRGEAVQIKLHSGDLILTTSGTALEPGFRSERVRVLSTKTKRELSGELKAGGVVEVKL